MKTVRFNFSALILLLFLLRPGYAQDQLSAIEAWQPYLDKAFVANFFEGHFNCIGLEVQESKEKLMAFHKGDHLVLKEGIDPTLVDYTIPIYQKDIRNMLTYVEDGKIDKQETFLIMKTLFTPMTAKTLKSEALQKNVPRLINRLENVTHVTLHSPEGDESVSHTLIYINKEWIVVPGLKGSAKRTFNMTVDDSNEYQKRINKAMYFNTKEEWKEFKKWYLNWRIEVSEKT